MKENAPENNEQNYPKLKTQPINKTNTEQQNPKTDAKKQTEKYKHNQQHTEQEITPSQQQQEGTEELTIIPETNPLPITQQDEEFNSPAIVTNNRYKILETTPNPQDIITPDTTPKTKESDSDTQTASETIPTENDNNTPTPTCTGSQPEIQQTPQKD